MSQFSDSSNDLANPPRILIVDDDSTIRFFQRIMLEKDGYIVIEAEDGAQALSEYERLQPNLVLLDAMMPLMDGFTTCARLRALSGDDRTPILMVTALQDDEAVARAFEVGATDYIIKPVNTTVLCHRVRRLLRAQQAETALHQSERSFRALVENQTELICRLLPECKAITSNDDIRGQQWTYQTSLDPEGNLIEVQALGRDITELRQVSAELRQKTAELQAVIKAIPCLFFRLNSEGFILDHYAGSTSDLCLPSEAIIGKYLKDVLPPEIASLMHETVFNVYQTKGSCILEYSLSLGAGERTFEARFQPLLDSQVIILIRDITEHKQTGS